MNRRNFLQLPMLLPGVSIAPSLLAAPRARRPLLIMIELKGGNDGLNTLIPIDDANYYGLRPKLAIPTREALKLRDGFALHPSLKPLREYWRGGDMAWIHGLGYKNPNFSHFRSIEIWDSGSEPDVHDMQGWISKIHPNAGKKLKGLVAGNGYGPLNDSNFGTFIMGYLDNFDKSFEAMQEVRMATTNPAMAHVLDVQNNVKYHSKQVLDVLMNGHETSAVKFPTHDFGQRMELVTRLIKNDLSAHIYKIEIGGFDTHNTQRNLHALALEKLATGLDAFAKAMQRSRLWDDVLIMTYSEFGRRVNENRGGGTDHGTAAAHMLMGGRVNGGFHGTPPSLSRLDDGNLIYTSDFRKLYGTVAKQWLGRPSPWMRSLGSFDLISS